MDMSWVPVAVARGKSKRMVAGSVESETTTVEVILEIQLVKLEPLLIVFNLYYLIQSRNEAQLVDELHELRVIWMRCLWYSTIVNTVLVGVDFMIRS